MVRERRDKASRWETQEQESSESAQPAFIGADQYANTTQLLTACGLQLLPFLL